MPPKATFTKESIIQKSIEVVRETGLRALSARQVAHKMGCSTAPIYQWFKSMEELEREIMLRVKDIALTWMGKAYTDRHFLNIGMGFAIFAREERELFKAFHLENRKHRHLIDDMFLTLQKDMLRDPRFSHMSESGRNDLLNKMWVFTFGLSVQIAFDLIELPSNEYIETVLSETGLIIIADALAKQQKDNNE